MNICIFPGTFNPIHNAHIKMAEFALQKFNFDKIIFIPAYLPPHKEISKNLAEHRLNMVKLATSNNSDFEVSDFEFKNGGKSYSIITVKNFINQYFVTGNLNFIIGTDAFVKINTWYHAEELKKLVHFIVFPRKGDDLNKLSILKSEGWNFSIAHMDYIDISSTEIRESNTKCFTKKEVEDYIKENGLYKI